MLKEIVLCHVLSTRELLPEPEEQRTIFSRSVDVFVERELGNVHMVCLVCNRQRGLAAKRVQRLVPIHRDRVFRVKVQIELCACHVP